jgi:hypothetical protein
MTISKKTTKHMTEGGWIRRIFEEGINNIKGLLKP